MPELPEVETIRSQLSTLLPFAVSKFSVTKELKKDVLHTPLNLSDRTFTAAHRKGKMLDFRLDDGSSVAFEISWAGHGVDTDDISIELLGIEGGLRLFIPQYSSDDTLRIYRDEAGAPVTITPEVHVVGGEHPLVIREFVDAIASGDWDAHRGDFALHRTAVLDACYRSAAEGREIRLEP